MMLSGKGEVKGYRGRFLPYGKDATGTALENAIAYVSDTKHASWYAFFATRNRMQAVLFIVSREQVLNGLAKYASGVKTCLDIHNGGIALERTQYIGMRQTFGAPVAEIELEVKSWKDIPKDARCVNAPKARAFEKLVAQAVNGKWVGGLNNLQYDVMCEGV